MHFLRYFVFGAGQDVSPQRLIFLFYIYSVIIITFKRSRSNVCCNPLLSVWKRILVCICSFFCVFACELDCKLSDFLVDLSKGFLLVVFLHLPLPPQFWLLYLLLVAIFLQLLFSFVFPALSLVSTEVHSLLYIVTFHCGQRVFRCVASLQGKQGSNLPSAMKCNFFEADMVLGVSSKFCDFIWISISKSTQLSLLFVSVDLLRGRYRYSSRPQIP